MRFKHRRPLPREGFTLIELLVVMAIIGVLVGMTAAAIFSVMGSRKLKTTKTLLAKLHPALQQHWREAYKEAQAQAQKAVPPVFLTHAGGDYNRARVLYVKCLMRAQFPLSYAEARQPWAGIAGASSGDVPAVPEYVKKIGNRTGGSAEAQMAACLYLALQQRRQGITFNADEAIGASGVKDTDGDGLPEIVDGWDNPVGYYRWPTENTDLDRIGSGKSTIDRDNEDPARTLMDRGWQSANAAFVRAYESLCHPISTNGVPRSRYTVPVIVSAGPDGKMGLNANHVGYGGGDARDNVYSFKVLNQ